MFEIPWIKYGTTEERYQHKTYLFKRKGTGTRYIFEIWDKGVLKRNKLTYWEFICKAERLMGNGFVGDDVWK